MAQKHKKRLGLGWVLCFVFLGLAGLGLLIGILLDGHNVALFNPKGLISREQQNLIIYSTLIMLVIAIPSIFLLYFVAWKYRESNTKAHYSPNKRHGRWFNVTLWIIPTIFMLILAGMMVPATHKLEPRKAIDSDTKPLTIQVISLRWKWLFIYPEEKIATVNFVQIPVDTPVEFVMTADEAPMSSFWVPNLAGQLYTMTGHVNRLNVMAETVGDYRGVSAEINGRGFAGMRFTARVSSAEDFHLWEHEVRRSPDVLGAAEYEHLLKPSENNPVAYFSAFESGLYDRVIMKYGGHGNAHSEGSTHSE